MTINVGVRRHNIRCVQATRRRGGLVPKSPRRLSNSIAAETRSPCSFEPRTRFGTASSVAFDLLSHYKPRLSADRGDKPLSAGQKAAPTPTIDTYCE
jgi:hypothetical protein